MRGLMQISKSYWVMIQIHMKNPLIQWMSGWIQELHTKLSAISLITSQIKLTCIWRDLISTVGGSKALYLLLWQ